MDEMKGKFHLDKIITIKFFFSYNSFRRSLSAVFKNGPVNVTSDSPVMFGKKPFLLESSKLKSKPQNLNQNKNQTTINNSKQNKSQNQKLNENLKQKNQTDPKNREISPVQHNVPFYSKLWQYNN